MTRVLHVHATDAGGGGSEMAYRIHDGIRRVEGFDSRLIVSTSYREDPAVSEFRRLPGEGVLTYAIERILSLDGLGSPSSFQIQRAVRDGIDLIHLHNIHGRFFNMLNVPLFPSEIPIVWTFHDMWPFTGKCVNSFGCTKYTSTCGNCPELDTQPRLAVDTTRLLRALKSRIFDRDGLTTVSPSEWMRRHIDNSFLSDHPARVIPNGIDTDRFTPGDAAAARRRLGLDETGKIVLQVTPEKGLDDVLRGLDGALTSDVTVAVAGCGSIPDVSPSSAADVVYLGRLSRGEMVDAYNAADITAIASRAESFGLVATESMACETPVVAYAVGGLSEQLTGETGWTAEVGDVEALGARIAEAVEDPEERRLRGANARDRVREHFAIEDTVERYRELYKAVLAEGEGAS